MNENLIIVDVQPLYHKYHSNLLPKLIDHIEKSNYNQILWFFNAQEFGIEDTIGKVQMYLIEYGLDEEILDDIVFIDKYYAFFRNWMDMGVDKDFIIHVIRHMISEDINDSRDIEEDDLKLIYGSYYGLDSDEIDVDPEFDILLADNIHIPHFKWKSINSLGSVDTAGGGCNKCLLEMEILLEAVNVKVNRLNNLTYV